MSDELFNREEFVSYFRDEAEELLQQIDGDLLKLEEFAISKESDPEIINSLFRALHTIKGSGGMLGFTDVQGLAHKLENLCDLLAQGSDAALGELRRHPVLGARFSYRSRSDRRRR